MRWSSKSERAKKSLFGWSEISGLMVTKTKTVTLAVQSMKRNHLNFEMCEGDLSTGLLERSRTVKTEMLLMKYCQQRMRP